MQEQIQQEHNHPKITRAAMEEELGDAYKRCWALAFKHASEELDFDIQVENLCREFDLIKSQAHWFVSGANSILFKQEATQKRQTTNSDSEKPEQRELTDFSQAKAKKAKPMENYVSQLEMMSFLEDIEQMCNNADFTEYWDDLSQLKQTILEQQCATEKEVLRIFKIRSMAESEREEKERFFNAYPISTDAWENGYFNIAGEVIYH